MFNRLCRCFPLCLLPILVLTGCVDLGELGKFLAVSRTANASFSCLVADMKASCLRFNRYVPSEGPKQDCNQYDKITPGLLSAQAVLIDYITALGGISSSNPVTFTGNIQTLTANLQEAGLNPQQVAASTSLADVIKRGSLAAYRKRKVANLIATENSDIQILTQALAKIAGVDYEQLLSNEAEAERKYYEGSIKEFSSREPLTVLLVKRAWDQDARDLAAKRNAAEAYVYAVTSFARGHEKLFNHRNHLTTKELVNDLAPEIGGMSNPMADLCQAFH